LAKKNTEIKRLKSNIRSVVNLSEDRNRRVKVDSHNQKMQDDQLHEAKANKLKDEIAAVKKKLQDRTADHKEKEQTLRKVHTVPSPQLSGVQQAPSVSDCSHS
jgi:phage host-nuclease inhibitor protein Gam